MAILTVVRSARAECDMQSNKPNRETDVQPTAIFLPTFSGHTVGVEEDIRLTQLHRFPAVYECIGSRVLREVHCNRIYLGFLPVVP